MRLEQLIGLALIGGGLWAWWKQGQVNTGAAAAGQPGAGQQLPGFTDAFGSNSNFQFTPGGFFSGPNAFVGKGGNVGPGQTDESASGSPFVYVNTSAGFPSGCSTHLWDGKPLCA